MRVPVYITSNNTYVRKSGDYLIIDTKGSKIPCPSESTSYIIKWGNSQISEQVLNFLAGKGIPIFRFSYGGKYCGCFLPPEHNIGKSRLNQYEAYFDNTKRLMLGKTFVIVPAANKIAVLKKHYYKNKRPEIKKAISSIKKLITQLNKVNVFATLRGYEANIAKNYFSGLAICFKHYKLEGRDYNPPKNEINCLLSFGYVLLYCEILSKINEHGLCPFLGYLHEQNNDQNALVYDLSEVFKQWIDLFVLNLVNSNQIKDDFFNKKDNACLLNTYGKRFFLKKWIAFFFLRQTTYDEEKEKPVSHSEIIREEVIKLKRFLEEGVNYEGYTI